MTRNDEAMLLDVWVSGIELRTKRSHILVIIYDGDLQAFEVTCAALETFLKFIALYRKEMLIELTDQNGVFTMAVQYNFGPRKVSVNPEMYLCFIWGLDAVKHPGTHAVCIDAHEVLLSKIGFIDTWTRDPTLLVFINKGIIGGGGWWPTAGIEGSDKLN